MAKKIIKETEKQAPITDTEKPVEFLETEKKLETKSEKIPEQDYKKIKEEIENMKVSEHLKLKIQTQSQNIKTLNEEKKIKKLLDLAQKKGVVWAINVAKNLGDDYLLDRLHDTLSAQGMYKKFLK